VNYKKDFCKKQIFPLVFQVFTVLHGQEQWGWQHPAIQGTTKREFIGLGERIQASTQQQNQG